MTFLEMPNIYYYLSMDMRDEAAAIIFEYMVLYAQEPIDYLYQK